MERRSVGILILATTQLWACASGGVDSQPGAAIGASPTLPANGGPAVTPAPSLPQSMQAAAPTPSPVATAQTGGAAAPGLPAAAASPLPMPAGVAASVDECGLHTRFAGDEYCIKPPPPDQGFQVHIGPSDYDNPESRYVLEPGLEVNEDFKATTGNEQSVYYFYRQQRMRPGSHHLLMFTGTGKPELVVSSQNPNSDFPAGGKVAPEDEGVGFQMQPRTPLIVSLHFINLTDKPLLKEVWVNFWYKDKQKVSEPGSAIFSAAPINIRPGQHVVVSSDCQINGSGRILRLFGHKHANNIRWSTYRIRGDQRDLVFEDYDRWEEPLLLEYNSLVQNPKPDRSNKIPGGWTGMLDVKQGDVFRYECEIVNNTDKTFIGEDEAKDDEMCIQNGTIVDTTIGFGDCRSQTTLVTN